MNILYVLLCGVVGFWNKLEVSPLDKDISFTVLLPQQNVDILKQTLLERASPTSPTYAKWLSTTEIDQIIAPKPYEPLTEWLQEGGMTCTNHVDTLDCSGKVSQVNNLFTTTMVTYYNHDTNTYQESARHYGYSIPTHIEPHIDFILGLSDFPEMPPTTRVHPTLKPVQDTTPYITPESIYHLYNMSHYNHSSVSSQAVAEFLQDTCYSDDDLQSFLNDSNLPNMSVVLNENWVNCDPTQTPYPDTEASLDIQYQAGVNSQTQQYYVSVNDWVFQFANRLYVAVDPPKVNSMSWGWAEWDQCDPETMPQCLLNVSAKKYTKRTNVEFMKLSLRGVTLLASSGDAGAPGRTSEGCNAERPLNPAFPTSSPWVLSVGGTIIMKPTTITHPQTPLCKNNTCIRGGTELNCNIIRCGWTSGGGFSNFFHRPPWQVNVSEHYLQTSTLLPPKQYFNQLGRIYPDISLVSHNFLIKTSGEYGAVDGTSASSPSVSGMISILNNMRVSNNKTTLGPVAPLFYHMYVACPDCFDDIIRGCNNSTEEAQCKYGYHAIKGFDAVYGLGVPNFDTIYAFIKNM